MWRIDLGVGGIAEEAVVAALDEVVHHRFESSRVGATRWTTTLPSKVNLHHAIDFKALCGANLVTLCTDLGVSGVAEEALVATPDEVVHHHHPL